VSDRETRVRAIHRCSTRRASRENLSELEWARRIAAVAGWSGEFVTLPADRTPPHLLMPGNIAQHWSTDTRRIREELSYAEPIAQEEAIRRTIEWERANPPTPSPHAFDYPAEDAASAQTTSRSG